MTTPATPPRTRTARLAALPVLLATVAAATLVSVPAQAATLPPPPNWPAFEYGGIVTDKDTMLYNPTDEYIFPSVFHAGAHLDDPLGEWYLYFAPHDAPAGIMLMYADSLEGPWTEYQPDPENPAPIIASDWDPHYDVSHVSSPDVIWHEETDEVFLYFHGENSTTRYASSTDGLSFEYGDRVVWNQLGGPRVTETSYARVFPHPDPSSGYAYGMFYMANETDNIRRIRLAESVDGVTWTVDPDYVVAPGPEEGANVSSADLWEWDGQLYVIYHASSGKSYARTIDPTLRDVGDTPILLHSASGVGDDVGRVAAPNVVTHEGETYLFYESGDRLGATIAWAKQNGFAEPEPPFGDFPVDPANPVFAECAADGSDEFEGDLAAGVWDRVVRADQARHEVTDGALTVPTYTGGVAAAPLLQQELPAGSWQVTTEVQIDATARFQQAGLLLYGSDTHYAKLDLGRATPGDTVEFVFFDEGANRQDSSARPADADRMWLRLTSDGTEIRASISYTGQEFTEFGRPIPAASAEFTHVGPYAFRGSTTAPEIDATFEWLRFSPDTAAYAACQQEPEPPFGGFPVDAANPVFAECAAAGSDEFDGDLAGGVWDRVVRADQARHEVRDGALRIPTYSGGVAAASLLQQELPAGAWQVTTEVSVPASERFQQAGLLLYAGDGRYAKLDLGRATSGDTVELVYVRDGVSRQDSHARPADTDRMWLRYTSDGTDIRASISYDGVTFTDFGRDIPAATAAFTHVGPYAFRGTVGAPEVEASFEWLRFSPDAAAYEECLTAPQPPVDDETSPPAKGVLSSTSGWTTGLHDGTFEVRMNIWWGANASRVTLYENGEPIETRDLVAAGPSAQAVAFPLSGRVNGSYAYSAELVNSRGTTWTDPVTVHVTHAEPARPVLSNDNWDGDGSYRVTANLWWGTNASSWRLLENGVEVASGELTAATPAAQRVDVDLTGRAPGSYEYVVEFANAAGVTASAPHPVLVR